MDLKSGREFAGEHVYIRGTDLSEGPRLAFFPLGTNKQKPTRRSPENQQGDENTSADSLSRLSSTSNQQQQRWLPTVAAPSAPAPTATDAPAASVLPSREANDVPSPNVLTFTPVCRAAKRWIVVGGTRSLMGREFVVDLRMKGHADGRRSQGR